MSDASRRTLFQYIYGNWATMVTFVYAELGIADHIKSGAVRADDLAVATGTEVQALTRVLDCARVLGLHSVDPNGTLCLGATGELLRSDAPGSLRDVARLNGADFRYQPWGRLLDYVRTGSGQGLSPTWQNGTIPYLDDKPDTLAMFEAAMSQLATHMDEDQLIARQLDWGQFSTILDLGSGNGTLLEAIVERHPDTEGTLFDVPEVITRLPRQSATDSQQSRLQSIAGNFFETVPGGFDAYLMKNIIHNHPPTRCLQLLQNIADSMAGRDARLFLIEFARTTGNGADTLGCFTDLNLNLLVGGSVRSIGAYRTLLQDAGLELGQIRSIPGTERVILECRTLRGESV